MLISYTKLIKMQRCFLYTSFLLTQFLFIQNGIAQSLSINTTNALPDSSAMLDIISTNKGLLIPRVSLTSVTDTVTVVHPAVSLLVYNTNDSMTGGNKGFWYWNGTQWQQGIGSAGVTGATGITGATGSLGTGSTGSVPYYNGSSWVLNSTNIYNNGGNVGIANSSPAYELDVNGFVNSKSNYDVSRNGLMLDLEFNKNNVFGTALSETALDASSYNNHFVNNSLYYIDSSGFDNNACFYTDSTNKSMYTKSAFPLPVAPDSTVTICFWLKYLGGNDPYIISNGTQPGTSGYVAVRIYGTSIRLEYANSTIATVVGSSSFGALNSWNFCTIKANYSPSVKTVYFYKNGELISTSTMTTPLYPNLNRNWYLFNFSNVYTPRPWKGYMDGIKMYARGLSDDEIKRLYLQRNKSLSATVSQKNIYVSNYGNIGIGTTNTTLPVSRNGMVIKASTSNGAELVVQSSTSSTPSAGGAAIVAVDSSAYIFNRSTGSIGFGTNNNATRMTIVPNGNVGIGTSTPTSKFDIEGGISIGASYSGTTAAPTNGAIIEGNVGIGIANPSSTFQVASTSDVRASVIRNSSTSASAPTTIISGNYLQLGGNEYNTNSYRLIQFGFNSSLTSNSPAYMGYQEKNAGGYTLGDLVFGTRNVITNTQASERMRITSTGNVEIANQLKIAGGSPGAGKVLTSDAAGLASWTSLTGTTLAAIGTSPNANGATLSGSTLNLEPASASYGGIITTGTQSFAGSKTFTSAGSVSLTVNNTATSGVVSAGVFNASGAGSNNIGLTATASGATNNVGINIYDIADATGSYAVYSSADAKNYFKGRVGIGTSSPSSSAILELNSTTGGLIVPRMTTTQKNALTAVNGMIVYDTTLNKFSFYQNGSWVQPF